MLEGRYRWLVFETFVKSIPHSDGMHDLNEILVQLYGVEELLLYIKCSFCWCPLSNRFVQPHLLHNSTNNIDLVCPDTIQSAFLLSSVNC